MTYKPEIRVGVDWDGDGFTQLEGVQDFPVPSLIDNVLHVNRWTKSRTSRWEDNSVRETIEDSSKGIMQMRLPLGDAQADNEAVCALLFDKDTKQHTPLITPLFDGNDLTGVESHTGIYAGGTSESDYGNAYRIANGSGAGTCFVSMVVGKDASINAGGATYGGIAVESGKTYMIQMWVRYDFTLGQLDPNYTFTAGFAGTYDDDSTAFDLNIISAEPLIDMNLPADTWFPVFYQFTSTYTGDIAIQYRASINVFGLGTGKSRQVEITGYMVYESLGWEQDSDPIYGDSYVHGDVTDFTTNRFWSLTDASSEQFDLYLTANTTNKLGFYIKSDVAKTITYVARSYEEGTKNYSDTTGTIDVTTTPQLVEITLQSYASNDYGVMLGLYQADHDDVDVTIYGVTSYLSSSTYSFTKGDTAIYDNLNTYLLGVSCQLGKKGYYDSLAYEGTLNIEVNNASRLFSPANTSGALYGKLIKNLRVTVEVKRPSTGAWEELWVGWTDTFNTTVGVLSDRRATISCNQGVFRLREGEFSYLPTDDQRLDEVITILVNNSGWRTAVTPLQFWLSNNKLLGFDTYLVTQADIWSRIDQGVHTYELIGDGWGNKTKLEGALKDMLTAEDAVLWVTRDGHLELRSRNSFAYFGTHQASIDVGTLTKAKYSYGDDLMNDVEVFVTPKEEEQTAVVWRTKTPIQVAPDGESQPILLTYEREEGAERTVDNLKLSQSDMDITVRATKRRRRKKTTLPPSIITDEDILSKVKIKTQSDGNGRTYLTVENEHVRTIFVDIAITGDYIKGGEGVSYSWRDSDAIASYGSLHKVSLTSKILTTEGEASGLARLRLLRNAYPAGEFKSITILSEDATLTEQILDLTLGDFISLTEDQTGEVGSKHVILGEEMKVLGGIIHMTYLLARLPSQTFMSLDDDLTDDSLWFV